MVRLATASALCRTKSVIDRPSRSAARWMSSFCSSLRRASKRYVLGTLERDALGRVFRAACPICDSPTIVQQISVHGGYYSLAESATDKCDIVKM